MTSLKYTPQIDTATLLDIIEKQYGLTVHTHKALPSERDQNLFLQTADNKKFVLKVANAAEKKEILEAQNSYMNQITAVAPLCPAVIPTKEGQLIATYTTDCGTTYQIRLISYLDGKPLGDVPRHSDVLMRHLGEQLGQVDAIAAGFDHPALHYHFRWDLAHGLEMINQHRHLTTEPELLAQIDQLTADYQKYAADHLPSLRQSAIHNDANDYNIIVATPSGETDLYRKDQHIIGFIDLGDLIYSHTINNLAIAIAYAVLDKADPLATAAEITAGYHAKHPLTEAELTCLFGLVNLRLCVSATIAAHNIALRPDDPYLAISQAPIRRTLPKLANTPYPFATALLRHACGLEPTPQSDHVSSWLRENKSRFASVIKQDLRTAPLITLDLSIASPLLPSDTRQISEPLFTQRIFDLMAEQQVEISVGRYDEPRLIYTNEMFATGPNLNDERRTIHLGIDLFAPAGTPVYAPLDGIVHICQVNDAPLDYGGLILLRHETDEGVPFFTLYGHLSHNVVEHLQTGQTVTAGEQIATFGPPAENGNWPPHLHFQLMTDLLGMGADYVGVGRASQRALWYQLSPDPNLILQIPAEKLPKVRSMAETLAKRRQTIGRNLSLGYNDHLKIVRGWQQYLYDETGQKYLDAYNNVPHVGHSHPRVVKAITTQAPILNTNTRYLHDNLTDYANALLQTVPDPLSVCFFVNSGSEANELALRLARAHTGQSDILVQEGAYHGHTNTLIDISPYKHDGPGGRGAPNWVHTVPIADTYRGPFKADDRQAADKYAAQVAQVTQNLTANGRGLAAFIVESCPSVGGQIIHPEGYLQMAFAHVREAGGLCIADEVQTGYGRIGTDFYAFQAQDVIPDIVVLGKPIGNGHPIGAVITTAEIAASFDNGMEFFSTFGGSTVSCAVGLAVLQTVLEENLQAHALDVGSYLLARLRPLQEKYPLIGDIRGSGLFLGIELVRDRQTLEPAAAEASYIANRMRDHHILLGTDGPLHNVVKIRPPMPFTRENADLLVDTLDTILNELV